MINSFFFLIFTFKVFLKTAGWFPDFMVTQGKKYVIRDDFSTFYWSIMSKETLSDSFMKSPVQNKHEIVLFRIMTNKL